MKVDVKNPLFILAAGVLLVTGSIVGATKAADSGTPKAQAVTFSTANLSVELQEKQSGKFVTIQETRNADGSLNPSALGKLEFTSLEKVNAGEEMPDPSITYDEEVQVKNNGDCQEYIRVVVYKNWINADKSKNDALDISSANLHLVNPSEWIVKESDSKECTTYYLKKALDAEDTAKLFDTISFDNSILNSVPEVTTEKTDKGTVTRTNIVYEYNGKILEVEMRVDAVQTHNAKDAILGAWGVEPTIDANGIITGIN
ncbi:hypothetical protein SAMN02910384_02021 [Pseudobutyrivibrio sp. ACV-2]|uniref:hypothetical protein n=1 Tax=Pseudobutyrivibrio sp. ACV-2 TaxID=1520801 RepID=UPI00089CFED9|nr:hypothetical protein [Pseudobutyrivibrio sp. ACV-2]SEA65844.1 hypothetical protein SAMN02910384_02021 [Pseudobutyrivibrio sp. ACV-2]